MAYPDLSDLRTRVRALLNETSTRFYTDAEINRWLNDGERDLATKGLCMEGIAVKTTTASIRTIAIQYSKVLAIEYQPASGSRKGLTKITPQYLGHIKTNGATPQFWFQWGNNIGIEPISNDTYTLNLYVSNLPSIEMSEDTDEPEIPSEFIPLIVRYAYSMALMKDGLFSLAGSVYQNYILDVSKIRIDILEKYTDTRKSIILPDIIRYGGMK